MKYVEDYAHGEIHKTHAGIYVFVNGVKHSGPYGSIATLKKAVDSAQNRSNSTATVQSAEVPQNLNDMKMPELRNLARNRGVEATNLRKADLIEAINAGPTEQVEDQSEVVTSTEPQENA